MRKLEAEIKAVDKTFMEPGNTLRITKPDYEKYRELKEQLNEEMNRWTELSQEVEEFLQKTDRDGIDAV